VSFALFLYIKPHRYKVYGSNGLEIHQKLKLGKDNSDFILRAASMYEAITIKWGMIIVAAIYEILIRLSVIENIHK
jgi:hypothetical protein